MGCTISCITDISDSNFLNRQPMLRKANIMMTRSDEDLSLDVQGVDVPSGNHSGLGGFTCWMTVILSPFNIIRPSCFRLCVFIWTSSASSNTRFMYSSNPTMQPSILRFSCSYSQIWIRERFWRYLKIKLMGCTITFCTLGPLYAILIVVCTQTNAKNLKNLMKFSTKPARNQIAPGWWRSELNQDGAQWDCAL